MERTRTIAVTITLDPHEEMFSVEGYDGESGDTWEYGPTPLWSDWKDALKEKVGNEIVGWVELMSEEE